MYAPLNCLTKKNEQDLETSRPSVLITRKKKVLPPSVQQQQQQMTATATSSERSESKSNIGPVGNSGDNSRPKPRQSMANGRSAEQHACDQKISQPKQGRSVANGPSEQHTNDQDNSQLKQQYRRQPLNKVQYGQCLSDGVSVQPKKQQQRRPLVNGNSSRNTDHHQHRSRTPPKKGHHTQNKQPPMPLNQLKCLFNEPNANWKALQKDEKFIANNSIKKTKVWRSMVRQQQMSNIGGSQQQMPNSGRKEANFKIGAPPHANDGGDNTQFKQQQRRRPMDKAQPHRITDDHQQCLSNVQSSRKTDHHPPRLYPLQQNDDRTNKKLNSTVGVVLSFSTLNREEMVDFFVYHHKQRKFSHVVQILRTKFPDTCQPGVWFRLLFHDNFDLLEHLHHSNNAVLIPRKTFVCQRRVTTRIRDEKVMFFVTAAFKSYCAEDGTFLYKCRLGMLKLTRAELNDSVDDRNTSSTTTTGEETITKATNSDNERGDEQYQSQQDNMKQPTQQKQQQQADHKEWPQRLKVWIWPSGVGAVSVHGYFCVKRIDARIWISNEPDSDSDLSSENGDTENNHKIVPSHSFSQSFSAWFHETVTTHYKENQLSAARRLSIEQFVAELQNGFRTETSNNSLQFELFGSVLSGFGSNDCDIDLCLVNTGIADNEKTNNCEPILQEKRRNWLNKLVKYLRRNEHYTVISVADARTPIVKFEHHGEGRFHGDISVENRLALHNTELLRLYASFDDRVPSLGFAIKRWAKIFGINDASAGSISSYAYIVMLIHFLQKVDPPVLPFLQKGDKEQKGQIVEGWKVSFVQQLPEPFSDRNTLSIAQLFYNFLLYYGYQFDVYTDVVQIRTSLPYNKQIRKNDHGYGEGDTKRFRLCVEDPFDLEHNLTSGVHEDTLYYIIKCFRATVRGMVRFEEEHFTTNNNKDEDSGDGLSSTSLSPKMSFDQLMRPLKPRRVIHLTNSNNNSENSSNKVTN